MHARLLVLFLVSCGGGTAATPTAKATTATPVAAADVHECGDADKAHAYDLHDPDGDDALVPCSKTGANDYSGVVHIETIPEGVHITINATDDEVDNGVLGTDVKTRDAVIVYPKGRGTKESVEVPLMKTKTGYTGDRIILWDQLDKLDDEGTKLDVAIFDHDKGQESEELHLQVAVSAGKSCEKAFAETPDTMVMGKAQEKDLTADQLGAPIGSSIVTSCGLPNDANSDICVTMKDGKALGASILVTPKNNKVAACIDKAVRRLHYPVSHRPNKIHKKF